MKGVYYIGLDVHKDTIQMAVLGESGKGPVSAKSMRNDTAKVIHEIAPYVEKGAVQVAYEAGCLGYTLYRALKQCGIDCRVIAPNKVFHRGGSEERVKTDKRDALDIAWMLRREEGESIAIPTEEDESTRDLIRCRGDAQEDLKRAKQRLLKFLLRHGVNYESTNYWTGKHLKWLKSLKFEREGERLTFEEYLSVLEALTERVKRLDRKIKEVAESDAYRERVKDLRAFRGIEYLTALALVVEIGDFKRFPTAQSFMSYLGLVPSEASSGKKRRQGGITKCGNGHLRRLLIETSWHYVRPVNVSKRLAMRRREVRSSTVVYADRAMRRLHSKYMQLIYKGKPSQKAVTAVARELSGFIWGVMNDAA